MKKNNVSVLVTGVGGGGLGEQLIKAFRLSDKINYHIVGTDAMVDSKGLMEVDTPAIVPFAYDEEYIPSLLTLCKKHQVRALFPGSEPELKVISNYRKKFKEANVFLPINTEEVLDIGFDKFKTVDFLKKNGYCFPRSIKVNSEKDLNDIDFFPAVLKPSVGGSGSANIMLAQTKEELFVFGRYLLNIYDEYIIQEYIGTPEQEYTVGVLASMEGELINSIALKRRILSGLGCKIKVKNRTGKKELGDYLVISTGISQGEIGKFEFITKPCEEMAIKIGARSAMNIQCRYFKDQVYVFEINPRYSGTTSLRAMAGYNEPDIMIRKYLFGESIEKHFAFDHCTIMRGLDEKKI